MPELAIHVSLEVDLSGHTRSMALDEHKRANHDNWDSRVEIHYGSDEYGIEQFLADPEYIGSIVTFDSSKLTDVAGKRLLHLQCHIGTDTVSWARLGAEVTGVDFSEKALDAARKLSADSQTPARFVLSELYDSPQVLPETFDIVYTGVGAINWLPDIRGWAEVVSSFLEPGGVFYMREGHPVMWALDWSDEDKLSITYPYFEVDVPLEWEDDSTYAGEGTVANAKTFEWNHGIAETLQALIECGLRIDEVEEYDFCEWQGVDQMVRGDDGLWRLPSGRERLPLMWSVLATKV